MRNMTNRRFLSYMASGKGYRERMLPRFSTMLASIVIVCKGRGKLLCNVGIEG
jgi:hypothetical protein